MRKNLDVISAYLIMLGLIVLVGVFQSWSIALSILCFLLLHQLHTFTRQCMLQYLFLTGLLIVK